MSAPSPNIPRNLFGNTTNNQHNDDTNTPSRATSVEPSPIAVVDPGNHASITPTDEQVLTSPTTMDFRLDYLVDVALNDQSPMALDTKYRVSAYPTTQASPTTNNIRAVSQQDEQSTLKRDSVRNLASFHNKRNKVTIRPSNKQSCRKAALAKIPLSP